MLKQTLKLFLLLLTTSLLAQSNKGEMKEIKDLLISSNNIQTILYNYGSISQPGALADVKDLVWNGLGYMYEFGPMIGAEVVDENGNTIHIISDSFVSPREGDYNANRSLKWGWLPEAGYSNSNNSEFANSKNPNSWSENWSEWKGEYGEGKIVGLNEAYYKMNDFTNAEFDYYPFTTDSSKRGLGVSAEVRTYQFGGGLKDALIIKYFVKNESDKDLNKVYVGFFGDPHIGGVGDVNDDRVHILDSSSLSNSVKNTIYLWDDNFLGRGGKHPGYLSFKLLETPDRNDLTFFNALAWADPSNTPKNDSRMWEYFTHWKNTGGELYNNMGDNVIVFGTGPFSLPKGETQIVKLAIFFSHNIEDVIEDAKYISLHHNWATIGNNIGETGGNENYKIELGSISNSINGEYEISWNYSGNNSNAKVFVEYSNNKGGGWIPLAYDLNNNDSFVWNTEEVNDGMNYIIRAVAHNNDNPKEYFYDISSERFSIDNPNFNAQPELKTNLLFEGTTISSSPIQIDWTSEDADNSQLNIKLEYSFNEEGPYSEIILESFPNGENTFNWDVTDLPNTQNCFVKITASDGEKDSTIISSSFAIAIFEAQLTASHIKPYRGNATPNIFIQTIDNSQLTNDEYSIIFHVDDDTKTFDIKNVTASKQLLSDYPLDEFISTPLIDGMKITVKDFVNDIDYNRTRYITNSTTIVDFTIEFPPVLGGEKVKVDDDYLMVFNNLDTLENGTWVQPDTMQTVLGQVLTPFSFWNIKGQAPNFSSKEQATFVTYEPIVSNQNNGQWDWGEYLVLQPQGTIDATTSYQIYFDVKNGVYPKAGDSLYIITYNQIENNDEFRFSPDSNFVVKVEGVEKSNNYSLFQNYPNPFNPTTIIEYHIPNVERITKSFNSVTLKIYDILGREVSTLFNKNQVPGKYSVTFDASTLSSGVYYYQLKSGNYLETKKMILLR